MARRHEFYFVDDVIADYRVHAANLHRRTIADRTEEPSIFAMLDRIYGEVESDPAREAAKRLATRGASFLDCPVTGGTEGARDAALAILVTRLATRHRR